MKISVIQRAIDVVGGRFLLCSVAASRAAELQGVGGKRAYVDAITELAGGRLPSALSRVVAEPSLPSPEDQMSYSSMLFELEVEVQWPGGEVTVSDRGAVAVRVRMLDRGTMPRAAQLLVPFDFLATGSSQLRWLGETSTRLIFAPDLDNVSVPVLFRFELREPGAARLTIDCFSRRQWVRSVAHGFEIAAAGVESERYTDPETEFGHAEIEEQPLQARVFEH